MNKMIGSIAIAMLAFGCTPSGRLNLNSVMPATTQTRLCFVPPEYLTYDQGAPRSEPTVMMTPEDCQTRIAYYKAQHDAYLAQQAQIAADQQRAAAAEARKTQDALNAKIQADEKRGYKSVSAKDIMLDYRQRSDGSWKIAIGGYYVKIGEAEYLLPSDSAMASFMGTRDLSSAIGLLSDEATRDFRGRLIDCQGFQPSASLPCPVRILGHVTICKETALVGESEVPCIDIEDGWVPSRI